MNYISEWVYQAMPGFTGGGAILGATATGNVISPNMISAISMGGDAAGDVNITVIQGVELFGLNIVNDASTYTINITPQAYVNWYNANIGAITQLKNSIALSTIYNNILAQWTYVFNGVSKTANYIQAQQDYMTSIGATWVAYTGINLATYNNIAGGAPSTLYDLESSNLYAFVIPSTAQSLAQFIANLAQQTTATDQTSGNQNVVANTQNIASLLEQDVTQLTSGLSTALAPWATFIEWMPWIIVGGAIAVIAVVLIISLAKPDVAKQYAQTASDVTGHVAAVAGTAALV